MKINYKIKKTLIERGTRIRVNTEHLNYHRYGRTSWSMNVISENPSLIIDSPKSQICTFGGIEAEAYLVNGNSHTIPKELIIII